MERAWTDLSANLPLEPSRDEFVSQVLARCGTFLHSWDIQKKREMFKMVNDQKLLLQQAYNKKLFLLFHEVEGFKDKLNKAMEDEEIYWKQRTKENWLKWGDKNTKWFHKKLKHLFVGKKTRFTASMIVGEIGFLILQECKIFLWTTLRIFLNPLLKMIRTCQKLLVLFLIV